MATKENAALEAAIDMLEKDHHEVDEMLGEFKKLMDYDAPASKRKALATKICAALSTHAKLEETIFYPSARDALPDESKDIMDHADVEHATLKMLIQRIEDAKGDDPHFDAYVHVMGEYVKHHVEEEEDDMFSELRKENPDMKDALKKMKAFKSAA